MNPSDLEALQRVLRGRRSVRHFTNDAISSDMIRLLLEDASWAPSGGDEQPWAVTAVAPPGTAALLSRYESKGWLALTPKIATMIESATKERTSAGAAIPRILEMIEREGRIRGRPWALFVHAARSVSAPRRLEAFRDEIAHRLQAEDIPSLAEFEAMNGPISAGVVFASVLCFVYALTLSAHARGLASCIQHSWLVAREQIQADLELPAERELLSVILVGYPDRASPVVRRGIEGARRRPVAIDFR